MFFLLRRTFVVGAAVTVLGLLLFGRSAASYFSTACGWVTDSVKNSVPLDFEIDRARRMVKDLMPDIRKNMHVIAKEEVEIDRLERQIKDAEEKQNKDRAELTRLGEGLKEGGAITTEAAERTALAIKGMVDEAHEAGCIAIAAAGTAGLRMARNSADVLEIIRAKTGVKVEVVSGDEEGRLAYLAVLAGLPLATDSLVVFDTGGGSSQFTFGQGGQVSERFSVNVGAVHYTERYRLDGAVSGEVLREALKAIAADLSSIADRPRPETLVAMGGAVTNLTAVSYSMARYDPDKIQGAVLARDEIDRQLELYRTTPLDKRAAIVGIQPKRADVILAGACIVRTVMELLGKHELTVSDRGLRHGLLVERFGLA
jgi:exopolyphosphatase/guanosine-5'-triphosphate,3'-diphosphate pyrophosphatase